MTPPRWLTPQLRNLTIASVALLGLATPLNAAITGAACPAQIDSSDCVANDLQPTGVEIISGPAACTEDETFAATVRVHFQNGGGANARYNVGFFAGENGADAIGGASCTFDSLQPIGSPPNSLGGPYAELNGDQCGDILKAEPTYKDISLDDILCEDRDGDGNVDISYVLTWTNNGNQANCTNPLDPGQFDPRPPKCLSDLDYDLPIAVEYPPSIQVNKVATPMMLEEPGGEVRYTFTILNTSPSASDPVVITSIIDQVDGEQPEDISSRTTCTLPLTLFPGQIAECSFTTSVSGVEGDVIRDTVTVTGADDEGEQVKDSASAAVEIIAPGSPPPPGELRLIKFATPTLLDEPGGTVRYLVVAVNLSETGVTLTSLEDDLYGNLDGKGSCSLPQRIDRDVPVHICSFEETVNGPPGSIITDLITAQGVDDLPVPNTLTAQDIAQVAISDVPSTIEVTKVASPSSVPAPGDTVTFSLQVQNTSVTDAVTITRLDDSQLGTPGGNCITGATLQPGEYYRCSYSGLVQGDPGSYVTNIVTVVGEDDDGGPVIGLDAATVLVTGDGPAIDLIKYTRTPFVPAAGGDAEYVIAIQNVSGNDEVVTITDLVDEVNGTVIPLDGVGTCDLTDLVLQPIPNQDSYYVCRFTQTLPAGIPGDTVVDTVTARGADQDGVPVEDSDDATVTYTDDALPEIPPLVIQKSAAPSEVPEPSGTVQFAFLVTNNSDPATSTLQLEIQSLVDDVYGDLFALGDCGALQGRVLGPGETVGCSINEVVTGNVGDTHTNTVTVTASDSLNRVATASDSATVTITDLPSSIRVVKLASPTTVEEPGGLVTFDVLVFNTSRGDVVILDSLVDNEHGDLFGNPQCPPPSALFPGRDPYICQFTAFVGGPAGYEERNTVTAVGTDDDGVEVQGSDQATVTVLDRQPTIALDKKASPGEVPASGGQVTFTLTIVNLLANDPVTLNTLRDSVYGDLDGQGDCAMPQTLAAGASYTCAFGATVSGTAGENHLNVAWTVGERPDGSEVSAAALAVVNLVDDPTGGAYADVPLFGALGAALLVLLLGWFGIVRLRGS
jgi:hypothetical protein